MAPMDILGYIGGGLVVISFLPQVIRVIKLKTANEISMVFTLLMFIGCLIWTAYAFYVHQPPMMVTGTTNTLLTGLLMALKCIYSRHTARIIVDSQLIKPSDTLVSLEESQLLVEENQAQVETSLN